MLNMAHGVAAVCLCSLLKRFGGQLCIHRLSNWLGSALHAAYSVEGVRFTKKTLFAQCPQPLEPLEGFSRV